MSSLCRGLSARLLGVRFGTQFGELLFCVTVERERRKAFFSQKYIWSKRALDLPDFKASAKKPVRSCNLL